MGAANYPLLDSMRSGVSLELQQIVAQALRGATRLLLALSGGLDSCVLLQLLQQLLETQQLQSLRAVHVHHGLSPQADEWATFCQRYCHTAGVAYQCVPVSVIQRSRHSLEAVARTARYAALAQLLDRGEMLVTAHHRDDQCETLLLALKRGSGPAGLAAMPECQPFAAGVLCRPLLSVSRVRLHAYAQQQGLQWVEDASNQLLQFDRNFLRHSILPPVVRRWPHFAEATLRSAQLCGEQEQLLDELLQPLLQQCLDQHGALAIEALAQCSEVKRQALLRRWCRQVGAPIPSRQQLVQLWSQIALSSQDANPQLQLGHWQVRRYRRRLYLVAPLAPLPALCVWQDCESTLSLPAGLGRVWLQSSRTPMPATDQLASWIRLPDPGERISWRFGVSGRVRIIGRGSRPLKKIYQEQGIPPWLRPRLPVLYYDDVAVTIPGLFVTEAGAPHPVNPAKSLIWQSDMAPFLRSPRKETLWPT